MNQRRLPSKRTALAIGAGVAVLLAVWALSVGTHGVVQTGGESERIVRDTRVDVGSSGPRGPRGLQGKGGEDGERGAPGRDGQDGPRGPAGPSSSDEEGAEGPSGPVGEQGPAGSPGVPGSDGARGPDGERGADGARGPQGESGRRGESGAPGADGAQGEAGPAGAAGAQGEQGPAGPQGPQGLPGPQGLQGEQGPAGPQGPQGLTGPEGPQGAQGDAGADGTDGAAGPQGPQGDTGPQGPAGPEGPAGPPGPGVDGQEVYRDSDVVLPTGTSVTVATMANVSPGTYLVMAKTTLVQTFITGVGGPNASARCTVNGDPATNTTTDDYGETELGRGREAELGSSEVGRATVHTQVTTNLAATGSFTLRCRNVEITSGDPNDPVVARETKIIAIKLGSATRTPVVG